MVDITSKNHMVCLTDEYRLQKKKKIREGILLLLLHVYLQIKSNCCCWDSYVIIVNFFSHILRVHIRR
jgi:hypothetical protein